MATIRASGAFLLRSATFSTQLLTFTGVFFFTFQGQGNRPKSAALFPKPYVWLCCCSCCCCAAADSSCCGLQLLRLVARAPMTRLALQAAMLLSVVATTAHATKPLPPPPLRPRASDARLARPAAVPQTKAKAVGGAQQPGPNLEVECAMRSVAYDMSQRHPAAKRHASTIHTSLQMDKCPGTAPPLEPAPEPAACADGRHWSSKSHEQSTFACLRFGGRFGKLACDCSQ